MSDNIERELGWDEQITNEGEFVLLPEGEYDFEVKSFARGRHNGTPGGLPPCNKAILKIEISNGKQTAVIDHYLFLHTRTEGFLSQFFVSIGQKKHGEPLNMNWNNVVGAKGRCKVIIDKWQGSDGRDRQNNKISKFLEPQNAAPSFTPGAF